MNEVTINNKKYELKNISEDTLILWVLRDYLNLTGTKFGCGVAQCGACTLLLENESKKLFNTNITSLWKKYHNNRKSRG